MGKDLRLPLKRKWFDMTKSGVKTEDYREINDYWGRRLLRLDEETEFGIWIELLEDLANSERKHRDIQECLSFFGASFEKFDHNILTLGYPRKDNADHVVIFKHAGIEIRQGNPDWGAEPGKIYFVIKHGEIIGDRGNVLTS